MNQPLNNTSKRLAQAAVLTLAITGISAPSFAISPGTVSPAFQINVQEPADPCLNYPGYDASWEPDTFVTLSEVGVAGNAGNPGTITVAPGADISMAVALNFQDGDSCGVGGNPEATDPTGEVTATWNMPASGNVELVAGSYNCDALNPCSAASTTSITATASVAVNATTAVENGTVDIEWVPAGSTP
jgi:hypothetical protein